MIMQAQASTNLSDEWPVVLLWTETGNDLLLNSRDAPSKVEAGEPKQLTAFADVSYSLQ